MTVGEVERRRCWPSLLALLLGLITALAAILFGSTASASATVGAGTRFGAFNVAGEVLVGPPQHETAGQHPGRAEDSAEIVVATGVAAKAATAEIDASKLTMTKTVEQYLTEYAKDGTLARPYGDSRLTIQEIMRSGDPVPDPGGVPGALRWEARGAFGKSSGTWELVVNPETNTILHFLFRSGQ